MKRKLQLIVLLSVAFLHKVSAQVNVTSTGGTVSASYSTLGAVCTAISAGTHTSIGNQNK